VQNDPETQKLVKSMAEKTMRMERELSRVMGGSAGIVRDVFTAILAGGHILLLGPSATTKELVCDAAQRMLGLKTGRARLSLTIPMSDVAGADIVEASPSTGETEPRLLAGPLFSQLFMAEDINRASPKIQSVVFAAMNERRILLTERTWPMPEPFCVVATQESSDWDGNCPLKPDSLDRIMFSVVAEPGGPDTLSHAPFESIICSDNVRTLYSVIRDFAVDESLVQTAVLIACATRPTHSNAPEIVKQHVATGAGPNAAYALLMGAKTRAVLAGRLYATEDDLRSVSLAALRHRISLAASAPAAGVDIPRVIRKVFDAVLAPATSAAH
jgi:MoxR-like ATPase